MHDTTRNERRFLSAAALAAAVAECGLLALAYLDALAETAPPRDIVHAVALSIPAAERDLPRNR